jgi:uncharacterized protein (TIGR02118 family)
MVRIAILYPNSRGSRFNFDYYLRAHMPRAIELLGAHPGYKGVTVEMGVSGAQPKSAPAYSAICNFDFDTVESFMAAFMPNAAELQGDIPNYTDVTPVIQVNEVLDVASR